MAHNEIPISGTPIFDRLAQERNYESLIKPIPAFRSFELMKVSSLIEKLQNAPQPPAEEPGTNVPETAQYSFTPAPRPFLIEDGEDDYEE